MPRCTAPARQAGGGAALGGPVLQDVELTLDRSHEILEPRQVFLRRVELSVDEYASLKTDGFGRGLPFIHRYNGLPEAVTLSG
jgi:hypothetical protein